jgi:hypothetical protein
MADIGDFARHAAERFVEYQRDVQERFNLGLPGHAVEEFIKAVFYASLIRDEGRYPSVSLMSYRKGAETAFHFLFDTTIQPSPQEIAKLAHAASPRSHICCICDKGEIVLGGVHVTMLNELREFGYISSRVANPLKVVIRGPGHIEMSAGGGIALIYKAGKIAEENLFHDSHVMRALGIAIARDLQELTSGTVEALDGIFNDLAEAIVRLGHGGILLIAKEPNATQFSSLRRLDCLFLQQLLVRYWDDVAVLCASAGGVSNLLSSARANEANPHALAVASDTAMLENCINSIAHLAGMDGAIVMKYDCKVAAFNAIIARSADGSSQSRLVDHAGRDLLSVR